MNADLVNRIKQCPNLPSLPAIAIQVLDLAGKPEADIAEIARVISKDPAMSSKILRTVNSSFYGRSQHVSTVSHALVILGLQSVKTLVLGFSLVSNLSKSKSKGFHHLQYWRRSIFAATAARTIASKINIVQQEEAFLAGLLKDIGMLVLDQVLGEQYGEICAKATTHVDLVKAEQEILGMTHAEVGAMLAEQWKLPPILAAPIAASHNPQAVSDPALRRLAEVVQLAGLCADVFVDVEATGAIVSVRKMCAETFKMSEADADALLDEIGRRTKEVATLFEINIGAPADFEATLKRANETLVELTLQSQQQATQLQQQNEVLQHQATTDGLTSLSNRARLDQFLGEQFSICVRSGKPLTLLMLDVDKFKSVNDKHGHQVGDQVLKALSRLLKTAVRVQDLAARYGGEEMVLILPGTTRSTGAAIAEGLCRAVAAKPIATDAGPIPVTISIGVASLEAGSLFTIPAHLIKAADMAVYAAKHAGRNCVKVFAIKLPASKPITAVV